MHAHESRRGFLRICGGAALAGAALPAGLTQFGCNIVPEHTEKPEGEFVSLYLGEYPELEVVGGMSIVMVDGGPTLAVVRLAESGDDAFAALDGLCTHAGCTLSGFDDDADELYCNCHGSSFDLDGEVTAGPAESPLGTYPVTHDEGEGTVAIEIG